MNLLSIGASVPQQNNDIPAWIQAATAVTVVFGGWIAFAAKMYKEGVQVREKINTMEVQLNEIQIEILDIRDSLSETKVQISGVSGKMDVMLSMMSANGRR